MTQYFRVTAYHPESDISVILDSNGMFEKLWQFGAHLISKGFKILEASSDEHFTDINIKRAEPSPDKLILRAYAKGKPTFTEQSFNGTTHKVLKSKINSTSLNDSNLIQ